jgi:hypothetical protein
MDISPRALRRWLPATIAMLAFAPAARADTINQTATGLRWYDETQAAVTASGQAQQAVQNRIWAVSWLAAARAVGDGQSTPFRVSALATALHDSLANLVPARLPQLDTALADTLASVPAGRAKDRGIRAGHAQAAAVLAQRAGDGLATDTQVNAPWTPPPAAPGVWQPTPPAFGPAIRAGLPTARSFLLHSNREFRVGPPPAVNSPRYLAALREIHAIGSATSTTRTPEQTDVANFIAAPSIDLFAQVLRQAIEVAHRPLDWQARLVAAFNAIQIDQQIAIYDSKYTYAFWRPVTAIRTGSVDPDRTWTPLVVTPSHPEYPSGHAGYAGTAESVLRALVGRSPRRPITITSATLPGQPRTYRDWHTLTQETIDGRVWEGVHFRFSDNTAAQVGREVAEHDLRRLPKLGLWRSSGGSRRAAACAAPRVPPFESGRHPLVG